MKTQIIDMESKLNQSKLKINQIINDNDTSFNRVPKNSEQGTKIFDTVDRIQESQQLESV